MITSDGDVDYGGFRQEMVMVTMVVQKLDRTMVMVKLAKPIEIDGDSNSDIHKQWQC